MNSSASGEARERLLLIEPDSKQRRSLERILRAVVGTVDVQDRLTVIPNIDAYDLLVVGCDTLEATEREQLLERFGGVHSKLLFVSAKWTRDQLVDLFKSQRLTNLVSRTGVGEIDPSDLIATIRKILKRDVFGLEKYFMWGVPAVTMRVTRSSQKEAVLTAVTEFAANLGLQPRFGNQLALVADEFVTNAVYNAPVAADGTARFAHRARSEEVDLEGESVVVQFCCDGERVGISIADPYGSLTVDRVLEYLARCFQQGPDQVESKEGGAGLGLYYVFDALSHFIINIAPGVKTEMIGLIDVRGSYRDFASRAKSFNVFFGPSEAAPLPRT